MADLSLPCFLSTSHACKGLVNCLLPSLNPEIPYGDVNNAIDDWSKHHDSSPQEQGEGTQAAWDDLTCRDTLNSLLNTNNPCNHCWLLAAQESHTAAWSEAFPIASVGNLLSPDELRIAIALRTGAKIILESSRCRCGKVVDELGLHGLSFTKNAGRFPRHSTINSILKRSLTRIGLPNTLQPVGLTNHERRLDGLTLGPWYIGLSLVWDATVVDTFAQGHYIKTLPDRPVLRPQKLRPQNAKNIMTSKSITTYNQWSLRPLVCMASPQPLFWVVLQRNLLMCLVISGSASGSTSVCPWRWSGEMLPAYWPVCEFDLTLRVLFLVAAFNVLITITAYHLPPYAYQCVAIASRSLVLSVRFIFPLSCAVLPCALVKYLVYSMAYDESTACFVFNITWNLWGQ